MIFFSFFFAEKKNTVNFMEIVSNKDTVNEMSGLIFWRKY